jgi:hypothetical protein
MQGRPPNHGGGLGARWTAWSRVAWTVLSYLVVQSLVLGAACAPVALIVHGISPLLPPSTWQRIIAAAVGAVPTYLVFALSLGLCTGLVTWLLGWRSTPDAAMRIRDLQWPLLDWARYLMATHVVRLLVGLPLRGTPVWSLFLRANGARVGHRTWVNSTSIADHCLLEFGDDTVVGADVHLSGHTVEDGVVKTGRVRVGRGVTIGVGSVIEIGVDIGDECRVGALSFVPKGSRLASGVTYAGTPVHRIDHSRSDRPANPY